jgi:hypothetical protein
VLEVRDLSIRFGGLQALQDVNLEVNEYEIVGLIGPNGAGKTTAFNCITGFYTPNTGSVSYRGKDVTKAPPHVKAAMGFGRTFQNVGMVKSSTALENLKTAQHAKAGYDVGSGLSARPRPCAPSASSRSAPTPSWTCWACRASATCAWAGSPTARSSCSSSAAPWPPTPTSCCSTSRRPAWAPTSPTSSATGCSCCAASSR